MATDVNGLVGLEIRKQPWAQLPVMAGNDPEQVPVSLVGLLSAVTEDEAERFHWQLEGVVVLSGGLYEAAPAAVPVLLAGLVGNPDRCARKWVNELLFQIVAAESNPEAEDRGHPDLGDRARAAASEGRWFLHHGLRRHWKRAAHLILSRLEPNRVEADEESIRFGIDVELAEQESVLGQELTRGLRALLRAETENDAGQAHRWLEERLTGARTGAAVRVLFAGLVSDMAPEARPYVFDLLHQLVASPEPGARAAFREGRWLLLSHLRTPEAEEARLILSTLDPQGLAAYDSSTG
ncbi:hypothetical protein L6E12_18250 [Actinokineospora sp. PR83]|uniref:hypothetical protein n=1 Tax=Actinokineospora sp. PR83 TaxID=2884908 RepID=UPI001F38EB57|nr:hypothetical protein [Actinokineospora sp. PR83]MCG8917725.1 hypothetical protein [Actinokineospora sp. PR83]